MVSTKIKIAAWLMLVIGILTLTLLIGGFVLAFIYEGFGQYSISQIIGSLLFDGALLFAFLFILFSYFLKKGKKWAWYASIILLLKEAVIAIQLLYQLLSRFLCHFSEEMELFKGLQSIAPPQEFLFYLAYTIIFPVIIFILVFSSLALLLWGRKNYKIY